MKTLTYGSVCSGIEAVTCAWHDLTIDGQRLVPRWFSEIAEFPSKVLAHHYPSVPNLGDFTKIGAEHGPVDVLVGGTPCQAFSVAGQRAGLDDPRGHLAIEFLRLARRLRARWVVWENVPGVLSDNRGETLATFLGLMVECGYGVAYRVLDAQFTGVPQRRRRVFAVGHLGDWRPPVAVLLERPSMQGDPRPRGKAGTLVAVPLGVGATQADRDGDGSGRGDAGCERVRDWVAHAFRSGLAGGVSGASSDQPFALDAPVAHTLTAHHGRNSGEDVSALFLPLDAPAMPFVASAGKSSTSTEQTLALADMPAHTIRTKTRVGNCEDTFALGEGAGVVREEVAPTMGVRADRAAVFVASDGSATEADVTSTLTPDGNRPARTMPMVVQEPFAFDEAQITSADNRSTVSPGGPVPTVSPGGPVPTVSATSRLRVASDHLVPRRLTPREVERCFGFPDDYTLIPGSSDSARYEALGNSMAVPVMRWIGRRLLMVDGIVRGK